MTSGTDEHYQTLAKRLAGEGGWSEAKEIAAQVEAGIRKRMLKWKDCLLSEVVGRALMDSISEAMQEAFKTRAREGTPALHVRLYEVEPWRVDVCLVDENNPWCRNGVGHLIEFMPFPRSVYSGSYPTTQEIEQ